MSEETKEPVEETPETPEARQEPAPENQEAEKKPRKKEKKEKGITFTREQVEKMGKGEWEDMREAYNDVPKRRCSRCKRVFIGLDKPFCEACGAPMTDEAVEMVMERLGGATR